MKGEKELKLKDVFVAMRDPRHVKLSRRIPSHDTFGRVFGLIDPREFEAAFRCWVGSVIPALRGVVSLDGKTSRRLGRVDVTPLHLVSAFAAEAGGSAGATGHGQEIQ
jgi:hypothetical protein